MGLAPGHPRALRIAPPRPRILKYAPKGKPHRLGGIARDQRQRGVAVLIHCEGVRPVLDQLLRVLVFL